MATCAVTSGNKGRPSAIMELMPDLTLEVLFDGNRAPFNAKWRDRILVHDLAGGYGA
ncbi:MAG: hypothetical protein WCS47_01265 [Thermovirgaceae bacterium]|nr:hypothetical protein [Synergistales bacterium]MDI9392166.1 hypothetical protein [Synergistota bacterium]NLV64783.1 hypothetical protein [Synergistaceae bacterium]HRW87704.1 hypothetical protein [Thermovirgaceae bacterium]MDD3133599.1 hypothetical protein [Synergistales bacterium]